MNPAARCEQMTDGRETTIRQGEAELRPPPAPPGTDVVSSWDLTIGIDGPGTRFTVFTAGCPLRCLYCQNPETWRMRDGRRVTVGESAPQPGFTAELQRRCHETGLHAALDTSDCLGERATDALLADTGLVLLDLRFSAPAGYRRLTGGSLEPTLRFARRLAEMGRPTWIRFVLVPEVTDAPDNVGGIARFVAGLGNVEHVDVLPATPHGCGEVQAPRWPSPWRACFRPVRR